jgi:hypothetical protein
MKWRSPADLGRFRIVPAQYTLTDYAARWVFIAVVGLVSLAGLSAVGVTVDIESLRPKLKLIALLVVFWGIYGAIGSRMQRAAVPAAILVDFCLSIIQLVVLIAAFVPLTYLAAAPGFPLLDGELSRLDALLFGFQWDTAARWVVGHPLLDVALQKAYFSGYPQLAAVLLLGSVSRPGDRNGDFIWQFGIAVLLTSAVFVFTPALGKVGHLGSAYTEALTAIRSGSWTVFDYTHAEGIITFPSFHTAVAVLLIYGVRRYYWALAVFIPLDALLIVATPTVGGHYLVDLPAGAIVAILAIFATRVLRQRITRFNMLA